MIKELSRYSVIHLFKFYIKCMISSAQEIVDVMYFAILMLAIFYVTNFGNKVENSIIVSIAMVTTLLSIIMTLSDLLKEDKRDGFLELIYLSGINLYWILFIKLLLSLIISFIIILSILTFAVLMFNIEFNFALNILISLTLVLPSLIVIILFVNIITLHYTTKIIQYILSLPLMVPLIISAISSTIDTNYWLISLGLNLIYLPLFIFFSRQTLEFAIISD